MSKREMGLNAVLKSARVSRLPVFAEAWALSLFFNHVRMYETPFATGFNWFSFAPGRMMHSCESLERYF
jgi:hypothetical protein